MANKDKAPSNNTSEFILDETSRCVSCGLCLPHCPTYQIIQSEADSPRGRIALMNGVVSNRIPMNKKFIQHMDRCLTCRACETACPNNVAYGQLIDTTRLMISEHSVHNNSEAPKKNQFRRLLEQQLIAKPTRLDILRPFFKFLSKSRLLHKLRSHNSLKTSELAHLLAQAPEFNIPETVSKHNWQQTYPAQSAVLGEVGLFLGCIARLYDLMTLHSSIFVLNHLGYTVHVPPSQTCCGAIHQHSGDKKTADQLAQQNKAAFDEPAYDVVITTASGCGLQLAEYTHERELKTIDISQFLISAAGWENTDIKPFPHQVAIHDPCTLRNGLRAYSSPYELVARIPNIQVTPLDGNTVCCGAAGTYFIDQPDLAKQLLNKKIDTLIDCDTRYLLTSNIGCALHITSGLREKGIDLEVLHPVTLLARQMGIQY